MHSLRGTPKKGLHEEIEDEKSKTGSQNLKQARRIFFSLVCRIRVYNSGSTVAITVAISGYNSGFICRSICRYICRSICRYICRSICRYNRSYNRSYNGDFICRSICRYNRGYIYSYGYNSGYKRSNNFTILSFSIFYMP